MIRQMTLEEFCEKQDRLNELTLTNWKKELTPEHYRVAILDELGELQGSGVTWKWWSSKKTCDFWNLKIEAIDIMHFYLSVLILHGEVSPKGAFLGQAKGTSSQNRLVNDDGTMNHIPYMSATKDLLTKATYATLNRFLQGFNINQEEVSAIFVAKCTLNEIRQNKGYKNGTYVKVKDGVEDNVRLETIVDAFLNDKNMTLDDVEKSVWEEFTESA